jgi:hypothetical protein
MKLDERRWAFGVRAPFDMPSDIPDLMGSKVLLDGTLCEIRGIVPNVWSRRQCSPPPLLVQIT